MKAVLCENFGPIDNLIVKDVRKPTPKEDEVRIRVQHCGLNFPDILITQGKYQIRPELPFSPGAEVAGIVDQIGQKVKGLHIGDRVIAATGYGSMAEYCLAKASQTFKLPSSIPSEKGAASVVTYGTVLHALKDRANIQKSDTTLVLGAAGGIGTASIQIAKALGNEVITAASSDEKIDMLMRLGADYAINYSEQSLKDEVKRGTNGEGVNIVVDPIGGSMSEAALRTLKWEGTHLAIGFASGSIPKIPLNLPLLKGCNISGVFWSRFRENFPDKNRSNFQQIIQWLGSGVVNPIIERIYAFEDYQEALKHLSSGKAKGKLVIKVS